MYNKGNEYVAATCDLLVCHAVLHLWLLGHPDRTDPCADQWSSGGSHSNNVSQSSYHHHVVCFLHQAFYNRVSPIKKRS